MSHSLSFAKHILWLAQENGHRLSLIRLLEISFLTLADSKRLGFNPIPELNEFKVEPYGPNSNAIMQEFRRFSTTPLSPSIVKGERRADGRYDILNSNILSLLHREPHSDISMSVRIIQIEFFGYLNYGESLSHRGIQAMLNHFAEKESGVLL